MSKTRTFSSTVVFSSIFLSVICFAGLIHVEMELHIHQQMLQVLNQQREEKLELRNTAHEDKESVMKMSRTESNKGKSKIIEKSVRRGNSFAKAINEERRNMVTVESTTHNLSERMHDK